MVLWSISRQWVKLSCGTALRLFRPEKGCTAPHIKAIEGILEEDICDRILPFDRQAASTYTSIAELRRATCRPIVKLYFRDRPRPWRQRGDPQHRRL
jgi:hypothetical protein